MQNVVNPSTSQHLFMLNFLHPHTFAIYMYVHVYYILFTFYHYKQYHTRSFLQIWVYAYTDTILAFMYNVSSVYALSRTNSLSASHLHPVSV